MRRRAGFALLAALWLVVAIGVVALQFSLDARERRTLGIGGQERAAARAATEGGLAIARSRLEQVLRQQRVSGGNADLLRSSDAWLDADSLFQDTMSVGGVPIEIHVQDLGAALNPNAMSEDSWRTFLGALLGDFATADELAQSIMDWTDNDELARPRGGEREQYLAMDQLVLPPNRLIRDVEELRDVKGMTPEILAEIRPFLVPRGSGRVNVNSAPVEVLRGVPGMTPDVIARIMSLRSAHRRIRSLSDVLPGATFRVQAGGRGTTVTQQSPAQRQLSGRLSFNTTELGVDVSVGGAMRTLGLELHAIVARANNNQTSITWESW